MAGRKPGPYREYHRNTDKMPRKIRLEVEEAIHREKESSKDPDSLEHAIPDIPFFSGYLTT